MAMFQFHTAFMLELLAFAAGLGLLHFGRAGSAPILRAAGGVLILGALLTAGCSVYYGIRYHVQGEFDHAYPPNARACMHGMAEMDGSHMGPHHGGMGTVMVGPGMMGPGMMATQSDAALALPAAAEPPAPEAPRPAK
jgi:hypothetical protein